MNTAQLPVLSESEKRQLLLQAHAGDAGARERMVEGNLRLVLSVVQRFAPVSYTHLAVCQGQAVLHFRSHGLSRTGMIKRKNDRLQVPKPERSFLLINLVRS